MPYHKKLRVIAVAVPLAALALAGGSVAFAASQDSGTATGDSGAVALQEATPSPTTPAPATPTTPDGETPSRGGNPGKEDCPEKSESGQADGASSGARFRGAGSGRSAGPVQY